MRNISVKLFLNLDQWFRRYQFLTRGLEAISLSAAESFSHIIFEFGTVVQKMSFKDIYYLELWWPLCSTKRNHFCHFGRGHYEEHSCEIILNLDQWLRRSCCLKKKSMHTCTTERQCTTDEDQSQ